MFGFDIDLDLMQYHFFQLGVAFILSLPIALNREMKDNGAGLRTFPLVTIASCAFMLVGMDIYESAGEARIMYAIITGMGFIGGGAIFKNEMVQKALPRRPAYGTRAQSVFRWLWSLRDCHYFVSGWFFDFAVF